MIFKGLSVAKYVSDLKILLEENVAEVAKRSLATFKQKVAGNKYHENSKIKS